MFVRSTGGNRGCLQRGGCRLVAVKDVYSVMAVDWLCVERLQRMAIDWFWYLKKLKTLAKVVEVVTS